ncbi:FAAL080Wp [Eremothecium gossypii FDAG1]|nr:FAAL080Wp [Eremothecium gossypii FDAG1]
MEGPVKKAKVDGLQEIRRIFTKLNTLYTFLLSRKHVLTTFETLRGPLEQAIKRPLEIADLARIAVVMGRSVEFRYVDLNQIHAETKVFDFGRGGYQQKESDIFQLKSGSESMDETQALVFEFVDGNMSRAWSAGGTPEFTMDQMRRMITRRRDVFEERLAAFAASAEERGLDTWEELCRAADLELPRPKQYVDPVQAMIEAQEGRGTAGPDGQKDIDRPPMNVLLERLKHTKIYSGQIAALHVQKERTAAYGKLDFDLAPEVVNALDHDQLYIHQAEALNAVHAGNNVIITTSTSSGKSLIYQLCAIDALLKDRDSTFMYIFPTKALAQDQKRAFQQLLSRIPSLATVVVATYDGDTEQQNRAAIRKHARVIFTNPDMIHSSILPNHPGWRHFLMHLKLVVVDELHVYKGLFGSHVALVMRRLLRLVRDFYLNAQLRFISCSATIKRPVEHMTNMFGVSDIVHVFKDGSPNGLKYLVVWNPPALPQHMHKRENFIQESAKILVELIVNNTRTIAFCYVRRVCELLMKEVRIILQEMGRIDLVNDVMSYRGGYSVDDRRKIEEEMFHGGLRAVISTNALELGIDIGTLDCVLMCGFPLSLANFHQQSGRAGRRNKDSLTLVVAADSPVDQHYVAHSEILLEYDNDPDKLQELTLDFDNELILEGHIQCAAFELPIDIKRDQQFFNKKYLQDLCTNRLQHDSDGYHANDNYLPWPPKMVSLRGVEEDIYAVVDITNGRNIVIEEIEASRTTFTLYDGGIFIHQGYPYLVKEFNADDKYAKVQRVDVDWLTSQRDFTDVDPQEIQLVRSLTDSDVPVYFGKIRTTMIVFGFFKVDKHGRILDAVETHNPPVIIDSKGLWIDIPRQALELVKERGLNMAGGIHAAEHGIIGLLPRFIVAGVDEINTECKAPEKEFAQRQTSRLRPARLVFYDSKGGHHGSGLSSKIFENIESILNGALQRIEECPCEDGCPDCVAASFCKERSLVISKPASLIILHSILGHDPSTYMHKINQGPEPNMAQVKVETIEPVTTPVKFAADVEIIDVRRIRNPKSEELEIKEEFTDE